MRHDRFWHFDKDGKMTGSDIGVDSNSTWCWDSFEKYFVKGEKGYVVFQTKTQPVEYFVGKFNTND